MKIEPVLFGKKFDIKFCFTIDCHIVIRLFSKFCFLFVFHRIVIIPLRSYYFVFFYFETVDWFAKPVFSAFFTGQAIFNVHFLQEIR